MRDPRALVVPGILVLAWLLFSAPHGLGGTDLLAGLAAAALGAVVVAGWPAAASEIRGLLDRAHDLLDLPGPGDERRREPAGDGARLDADTGASALEGILEALARDSAADRLIVWRVAPGADRIRPEWAVGAAGPAPPAASAAGNPLGWALREGSALRLDPAPAWARGAAVVAPVDARRVLTLESAPASPPDPATADRIGRLLGRVLTFADREADALAARDRLDRVVAFLKALPRHDDPGRVPDSLARAALDLLDVRGALAASWDGERGIVLTREGLGGGPVPGTGFGPGDGDLAHAVRLGGTLRRDPTSPGPGDRPLAHGSEAWDRPHLYRVVVPLVDPGGGIAGLVAGWGDAPPSEQGIGLVEALAPLLALHLRQASDLARFRERATADPLTGLPNRAALMERMAEERARFHRYRRPVSLLVLDLDHFKAINDTHGHEAGDQVLRRVAAILRTAIRDVDVPARVGGEEMVVVLPETMLRAALEVAERVRDAIEAARIDHDGVPIPVTASIGVSACPECVDDPDALFRSADQALYASKEAGRNRVTRAQRATSGA